MNHIREVGRLQSLLSQVADGLLRRVSKAIPENPESRDAFEQWRAGFELALANPANPDAGAFMEAAWRQLAANLSTHHITSI